MSTEFLNDFIAGWIGGCMGLLAGHPMDTIKVRQQVMSKVSASQCVAKTFKHEGVRGFYKGMGSPMLATGTLNSIFFGVYGNVNRAVPTEEGARSSYHTVFWAACAGGVAQLAIATPVELAKIKMQMQIGDGKKDWSGSKATTKGLYSGPLACLRDLYRKFGIAGCYKGLIPMAIRDVPSYGLYMMTYEAMIRHTAGKEENASTLGLIFCGGMAGGISWLTVVPLDVIKSRFQADDPINPKYKGTWDCAKQSYKAEGLRVFTRGSLMVTLRAVPTNGAIFLGYVSCLKFLREPSGETAPNAA